MHHRSRGTRSGGGSGGTGSNLGGSGGLRGTILLLALTLAVIVQLLAKVCPCEFDLLLLDRSVVLFLLLSLCRGDLVRGGNNAALLPIGEPRIVTNSSDNLLHGSL